MIYRISIINADGEVHYKWVLEENIDTITSTDYSNHIYYDGEYEEANIIMKNGDVIKNIRDIKQVPIIDN